MLKNKCYPKMVYTDIYISLVNNIEIKKDKLLTIPGVKINIGQTKFKEPGKSQRAT